MDKYDPNNLTEFPRFEAETNQSSVSSFFTKFWKPLFSQGEQVQAIDENPKVKAEQVSTSLESEVKTETGTYAVEIEGRSLPNVLRRISSLVAMGSGGKTRYEDTDLARYWMPDDISRECYECAARFSTLKRRHHCRVCGQIFCARCCSQRVPGHIFGCTGGLRVCNYCCNVVLSYLKENDMCGDISPDLRTLQENLQIKFPENKKSPQSPTSDSFMFGRDAQDKVELSPTKDILVDIYRRLTIALPTQQHRYRLVRYNEVWQGCDILQWVMDHTSNKSRVQATIICQNLLSSGYLECCNDIQHFADHGLYKPIKLPPIVPEVESPQVSDNNLVESVSSYCLDLNLDDSSARIVKASRAKKEPSTPDNDVEDDVFLDPLVSPSPSPLLEESGREHLRLLLRQCLARHGLNSSWVEVLYQLSQQVADHIVLDKYASDIDVRKYVHIKKVPGGVITDSCLINGVVMTKNVAHRAMPQQLNNPTILVLDCSIAYHRVEGKLTSLESVLLQEQEYLSRCVSRVLALGPGVVCVGGGCALTVQSALSVKRVALAQQINAKALSRLARCVRADVLQSVDSRIGMPRLGTCRNFYCKNFSGKTLMMFEECADPNIGCSILLRGASIDELARVKKVAKFMILACYNWKLEKSFLKDIGAKLPEKNLDDQDGIDNVDNTETIKTNVNSSKDNEPKVIENSVDNKSKDVDNKDYSVNDKVDTRNKNGSIENNVTTKLDTPNKNDSKELENKGDSSVKMRKTDSDRSITVPIKDFSDPLRSSMNDEDVFVQKDETVLQADSRNDRWSTDDVVLTMSPNVLINAPFLATEAGKRSPFRNCFPDPLFPTHKHHSLTPKTKRKISRLSDKTVLEKDKIPRKYLKKIGAPARAPWSEEALHKAFEAMDKGQVGVKVLTARTYN